MQQGINSLQNGINDRQAELSNLVTVLADRAWELQRKANWLRVATIALSAIIATRATVDAIAGSTNRGVLIAFLLASILTTVLLGIEAAFKFDKRAAELNGLAATARSAMIAVDGEWRRRIGSGLEPDTRAAAGEILALQESKLADIHQRASTLGLSIVWQIRQLERPGAQPFAA